MLKLSYKLKTVTHFVLKNIYRCIVAQGYLDTYMDNALASVRLLCDIAKDLSGICFTELKSIKGSLRIEAWICSEMNEAGSSFQNVLFNCKKVFKWPFFVFSPQLDYFEVFSFEIVTS